MAFLTSIPMLSSLMSDSKSFWLPTQIVENILPIESYSILGFNRKEYRSARHIKKSLSQIEIKRACILQALFRSKQGTKKGFR